MNMFQHVFMRFSKPKTPTQLKHNPATSISDDFVVIISFDLYFPRSLSWGRRLLMNNNHFVKMLKMKIKILNKNAAIFKSSITYLSKATEFWKHYLHWKMCELASTKSSFLEFTSSCSPSTATTSSSAFGKT